MARLPATTVFARFPINRSRAFHFYRLFSAALFFCLLFHLAAPRASADVGVVLNESLDEDFDRISSTGHSAIYFSRICPESPVKLRLCRPGEVGSVMSNYLNIGEDEAYEWNIVPLNIYLFGVEDPRDRPLFASYKIKHLLEERYREKYLSAYCASEACRTGPKAEWREMVAATMIRGVYIFNVSTTETQDLQLIADFNTSVNENHFNGVTRNCADFTKRVINSYFPHSARADYLNDFGMTSPKAVARTFTRYARHHPESNFRVMHFAQVPGVTKRSRVVRSGTEQLFHSGKLLLPMALISYYSVPVVAASYFTTAHFNAQKEFQRHPDSQMLPADAPLVSPEQIAGTDAQWKALRKSLDSVLAENRSAGDRSDLNRFFKQLDNDGSPFLDADGAVWMDLSNSEKTARLGLSAGNILAPDSESTLAYKFLAARVSHFLKGPQRSRETMPEFAQDWTAFQRASAISVAGSSNVPPGNGSSSAVATDSER